MAEKAPRRIHNRRSVRLLGAASGLVAAPFIYMAVTGGEQSTHANTNTNPAITLVDYQTSSKEGTLVFSNSSNKNIATHLVMSAAVTGNPLSNAPLYDKIAAMALVEGAGAVVLAGQKRTHEASNLTTRWTAYAGAGLGIVAANVIALSAITGLI